MAMSTMWCFLVLQAAAENMNGDYVGISECGVDFERR